MPKQNVPLYSFSNVIKTTAKLVGVTASIAAITGAGLLPIPIQPVSAASTACERQTVNYGSVATPTEIVMVAGDTVEDTAFARASGVAPKDNSTDVDISRKYMISAGSSLSSYAFNYLNNGSMRLGTEYSTAPTGSMTGVTSYLTPVRGLQFSVQDIELVSNNAEVATVNVYQKGSVTPIADLSAYHTPDASLVFSAGKTYTGTLTSMPAVQGNVNFVFPSSMEIEKVEVVYTINDAGDTANTQTIIVNAMSFNGPCIGLATKATANNDVVTLDYTIKNTGGLPLTNIALPEDLDARFGAGNYTIVTAPKVATGDAGTIVNSGYNGNTNTALLGPGSGLDVGESAVIQMVVRVHNSSIGGDTNGNYTFGGTVTGRPLAETAQNVSDDSVDGVNVNPTNDPAGPSAHTSPTIVSVKAAPGTLPKTGENTGYLIASALTLIATPLIIGMYQVARLRRTR